jgi:hypothetical protein
MYSNKQNTKGNKMINVTHTDIVRSYTGKVGCMCGCLGTYRDTDRSKKIALTKLRQMDYKIEFWKSGYGDAGCIHAVNDAGTRTVVAYFDVGAPIFADDVDQATLDAEA